MQNRAGSRIIKDTVHDILEDEISHSRIGWAYLAFESNHSEIAWVGNYIPAMIKEAMQSDIPSMVAPLKTTADLSTWGILPRNEALTIMKNTVDEVILPGLKVYGVVAPS
jgi:hypothetical protein